MKIEYKKINDKIFENAYFEGNQKDKELFFRDDALALVAMDSDTPVGFICVTSRFLAYPLEHLKDAYIEILDVDENYRRQGIGQHLVACAEEWAKKAGLKQIRTHSNNKAVEAIKMWHKLNYGLCQHVYYAEEGCAGYWVAKVLSAE